MSTERTTKAQQDADRESMVYDLAHELQDPYPELRPTCEKLVAQVWVGVLEAYSDLWNSKAVGEAWERVDKKALFKHVEACCKKMRQTAEELMDAQLDEEEEEDEEMREEGK